MATANGQPATTGKVWTRKSVWGTAAANYAEGVDELFDAEEGDEPLEELPDVVESLVLFAEERFSGLLCARLSARESVR